MSPRLKKWRDKPPCPRPNCAHDFIIDAIASRAGWNDFAGRSLKTPGLNAVEFAYNELSYNDAFSLATT